MFVCAECGASQHAQGHCGVDGSPLLPIGDEVLLGTTIGAYRVARLLGVGGMGRVYKGVHPTIGSRVAIKVLSRECSDRRDLVDRFFAEAKAVNLIRHESIVNVLDLSTLPDGRPYIVMEYLDGAPLAGIIEHARLGGMPLPLGGIARLVAEVLDALGAAHAKGIVHRDLKPDNIFITPAGRAKVLDFGIAKLQPELGGSATHTGSLLGTPHYMAPEQAAGRPVDTRADIYAIGVILFECATLHKPFVADSLFDLLRKHIEAPPPSPRALRPDMPPPLEQLIYTALAKLPEQRFASTHAMSTALQHATMSLPGDQWTPIQPANSSRSHAGGWHPTPPASWAGAQRPSVAVAPTQTGAGQVTPRAPQGAKRGLWLALGGLVLVGGGVTAGVIAGGGHDDNQVAATGSDEHVAAAGSAAVAPPTTAPTTPPTTAPTTPADRSAGSAADDERDIDTTAATVPAHASKDANHALGGAKPNRAAPPTTPQIATSSTPPRAGVGLGPDGWVVSRRFMPSGFDPKRLSVEKYLPLALAEAKKLVPDAVLFRIDADGVFPDGHADITLTDNGSLDFRFISPSHAKPDPSLPVGAKQDYKCMFRVMLDGEGAWSAPINGWECKEPLLGPPKCTTVEVWKKALARGAPNNAIAELGYRGWANKAKWYVSIDGTKFSEVFEDDCR